MTNDTGQPSNVADLPKTRQDGSGRGIVVPILLGLLVVSVYLNVFAKPVGPPPGWGNDFEVAMAEAKESDKPVVVVFYADG